MHMHKVTGNSDNMEEILSLFFSQISLLCFDKAKEIVERERDTSPAGPYRLFLSQLPNLLIAEKSYVELGFVSSKNKIFLRKDNSLKSMYEQLRQDLHKLEESSDIKVALMAGKICHYLMLRSQLIDIYEKLYGMGSSNRPMKCEEVLTQVEGILDAILKSQSDLNMIKASCMLVEIKAYIS
uniref:Uncharacterized protein n=1 Tax=Clastoptera arizonana TaxID=38151 RepID=A0A1B6CWI9_9HEMI